MKCIKDNKPWSFRILIVPLIVFLILVGSSCKSQKDPSVSIDKLISQINEDESQKTEEEKRARIMRDSLAKLPRGFRYEEDRSVDPDRPPIVLHFIDSLPTREYKLSDIANELEYIVLKTSLDSTLFIQSISLNMGNDLIVCYNMQGADLYDRNGNYVKNIVKNSGIGYTNGYPNMFSTSESKGISARDISMLDDSFIYYHHDGPQNSASIIEIDQSVSQSVILSPDEGNAQEGIVGKKLKQIEGYDFMYKSGFYQVGGGMWTAVSNKWSSGSTGDLLTLYGPNGDTLCQFKDYDLIHDYPGGPHRGTDNEFKYHFGKTFSFKPENNDTLFRVIPPNRLLPTYIFDFGDRKLDLMDGLIRSKSLKGKNMAYELYETNKYLFFVYSQDRQIWWPYRSDDKNFFTLIDKSNYQIHHISSIKSTDDGIYNDIDGGSPFWPDGVNGEGYPYMYCTGEEFKSQSKSKRISGLDDRDIVIILAK